MQFEYKICQDVSVTINFIPSLLSVLHAWQGESLLVRVMDPDIQLLRTTPHTLDHILGGLIGTVSVLHSSLEAKATGKKTKTIKGRTTV